MKTVTVTVDVELSDIETDDLIEELELRGHESSDCSEQMTEMFYAFKLGKTDHAMDIAMKVAQEHTGMIL